MGLLPVILRRKRQIRVFLENHEKMTRGAVGKLIPFGYLEKGIKRCGLVIQGGGQRYFATQSSSSGQRPTTGRFPSLS